LQRSDDPRIASFLQEDVDESALTDAQVEAMPGSA
jgi:hypothetical protein